MKEFNEAQIWSAINGYGHESLVGEEQQIAGYMPIINELFPGINYYSVTGFTQVMADYVGPVLTKLHPSIAKKSKEEVNRNILVSIEQVLPCDGYEHLDNSGWKKNLDVILSK